MSIFFFLSIYLCLFRTSPRVWFEAGEQGVTLELAWGPRNSLRNFSCCLFYLYVFLVSCFSSFFLFFLFLSIYLLGHCGNFSDTVVGSSRLLFLLFFPSTHFACLEVLLGFFEASKKDRIWFKNATESLEQDTASQMLCSYEWIIQSYFPSYQQLLSNPQQALLKLSRNNIVFYTRPE